VAQPSRPSGVVIQVVPKWFEPCTITTGTLVLPPFGMKYSTNIWFTTTLPGVAVALALGAGVVMVWPPTKKVPTSAMSRGFPGGGDAGGLALAVDAAANAAAINATERTGLFKIGLSPKRFCHFISSLSCFVVIDLPD